MESATISRKGENSVASACVEVRNGGLQAICEWHTPEYQILLLDGGVVETQVVETDPLAYGTVRLLVQCPDGLLRWVSSPRASALQYRHLRTCDPSEIWAAVDPSR